MSKRQKIVGLIYDAALDRKIWPLVADYLADVMNANVCQFSTFDSRTGVSTNVAPRVDPKILRAYAEHWAHKNPLIDIALRKRVRSPFTISDLMPIDEFTRTEIFNEFFAPAELEEALGGSLLVEGSYSASFGLWRPSRKGAFADSDREMLSDILPHLRRAFQLTIRLADLETSRNASVELLEMIPQACMSVDNSSRVQYANRSAEELLAEGRGLRRGADGTLGGLIPEVTTALHGLIARATDSNPDDVSGGEMALLRGPGRAPLRCLVVPVRTASDWLVPRHSSAVLLISDPEKVGKPDSVALRQEFGLTPAEAAVAIELLNGRGLKAAAKRLGVSPTTVRTHLSAVFNKTNTHRQAELIQVMLRRVANWRRLDSF
jgi:DNA-binding CsgD family transcriptional regulator